MYHLLIALVLFAMLPFNSAVADPTIDHFDFSLDAIAPAQPGDAMIVVNVINSDTGDPVVIEVARYLWDSDQQQSDNVASTIDIIAVIESRVPIR